MLRNWIIRKLTERRRRLFVYWDGRQTVRADPMVIMRRMSDHETFDPDNDYKRLKNPNSAARGRALEHLAQVSRDVFDLPTFDGRNGLTELELLHLLTQFNASMAALKKNMQPSPEFPPSTGPSPMGSDSMPESNTSDSLASGSIPQTA